MLELYKDAILTEDIPSHDLCAGDIGVVVDRHIVSGKEIGYSIEFFDLTGNTIAVVTVPETALREPTANDRPSVRRLANAI